MEIKPTLSVNSSPAQNTLAKPSATEAETLPPISDAISKSDVIHLSSVSLVKQEDFDSAVKSIQKEALEGFTKPEQGLFGINAKIDVGRYNLYLVDQQIETLQGQYGESLNTDALKKQLIDSSGIVTENPLKGLQRQGFFYNQTSFYYLKEKDVQTLTDVYIHAKENNLDTEEVNNLGSMLGAYRMDEAKFPGLLYPDKRKPYDPEVIEQAKAIYSNDGTGVAQFEQGFLDYSLNPEKNLRSFAKVVDLDFFEQITGTGDGEKAFLHTPLYNLGDGAALRPEGRLEALKETLSKDPLEIDTSDLSPEEAIQHYLTQWLETQMESSNPMQQLIADLSQDEQMQLFSHLNTLKLL